MVVEDLTSFVYKYKDELFESIEISNCKLVIDGDSLMFHLLQTAGPSLAIGQEHERSATMFRLFILHLRACGITPYVVFLGPSALYEKEEDTDNGRACVAIMEAMFHKKRGKKLKGIHFPATFSFDTIQSVFQELQVPYCVSVKHAEAEIVALANKLQCPVLSGDSDFFIFSVEHGFLPLKNFCWSSFSGIVEPKNCSTIKCLRFYQSSLCKKWNISPIYIPFLSMILGNDWLPSETFHSFLWDMSRNYNICINKTWRLDTAIQWLSFTTQTNCTTDSTIAELMRQVPLEDRTEVKERVLECYSLYTELPDVSDIFPFMQNRYNPEVNISETQDIDTAIRYGLVFPGAYHICTYGYVNLPTRIVCDTKAIPPHFCCREIRDISTALLFRRFYQGPSRSRFLVAEYDMGEYVNNKKEYYGKRRILNFFRPLCPCCQKMHCFDIPCTEFLMGTDGIIKGLLGISIDTHYSDKLVSIVKNCFSQSFCKQIDTVMLAVLYWYKKAEPEARVVTVLLLVISKYLLEVILRLNSNKGRFVLPNDPKLTKAYWDLSVKKFDAYDQLGITAASVKSFKGKQHLTNAGCSSETQAMNRNNCFDGRNSSLSADDIQSAAHDHETSIPVVIAQQKLICDASFSEMGKYKESNENNSEKSGQTLKGINIKSVQKDIKVENSGLPFGLASAPQSNEGSKPPDSVHYQECKQNTCISEQISMDISVKPSREVVENWEFHYNSKAVSGHWKTSRQMTSGWNSQECKENSVNGVTVHSSPIDQSSNSVNIGNGSSADVQGEISCKTTHPQNCNVNNVSSSHFVSHNVENENPQNPLVEKMAKCNVNSDDKQQADDLDSLSYHSLHSVFDVFGPCPPKMKNRSGVWWIESIDYPDDMVLLHGIAQWECCLWAVSMLHQSAEFDGMCLGLNRIYGSNMASHEINARLEKSKTLDEMRKGSLEDCYHLISKLLSNKDIIMNLYKDIFESAIHFLMQF